MFLPTRMLTLAAVLATALASAATMAQIPSHPAAKTLSPQQQRMSDCNKSATGKAGDDRKTYMSACLKGESAKPALSSSQQRMKDCNAKAASQSLAGDKRKTFMSACLKGS